jgi:hypothetical protein
MNGTAFTAVLFVAAALLAAWVLVRFPALAPSSLVWRGVAASALVGLTNVVPVSTSSYASLYCSVFLVLLPLLTAAWLAVAWVLQALGELGALGRR